MLRRYRQRSLVLHFEPLPACFRATVPRYFFLFSFFFQLGTMFAGVFSRRNLVPCRVPPVSLAFQETGQSLPVYARARTNDQVGAIVSRNERSSRLMNACFLCTPAYTGGRAHRVAVLSAEVLRNENSVGCHRPEITLSWCCATTTLSRGIVRSPADVVN